MLRDARAGDEAAIEAFLARHAETSMFLRANLHDHGLSGSDGPRATRFWVLGDPLRAVFGRSNAGFLLVQASGCEAAAWAAWRRALAGTTVAGLAGAPEQVDALTRALGLDAAEPLYRLRLDDLRVPTSPGEVRPPAEADRDLIFRWTRAYSAELHMSSPDRLDEEAQGRAERALASGDVRLLDVDGSPVAMTAFNARLPDMVQIGGVYTPPELRERGHARRAVALHLAEARAEGVETAILFASGPAACRAYESIGFERIGAYTLATLKHPVTVGAHP